MRRGRLRCLRDLNWGFIPGEIDPLATEGMGTRWKMGLPCEVLVLGCQIVAPYALTVIQCPIVGELG